jgi:hypothetical protein
MSTDALPLPDFSTLSDDPATLRQLVLQLLEALQGERDQREKLPHHIWACPSGSVDSTLEAVSCELNVNQTQNHNERQPDRFRLQW